MGLLQPSAALVTVSSWIIVADLLQGHVSDERESLRC